MAIPAGRCCCKVCKLFRQELFLVFVGFYIISALTTSKLNKAALSEAAAGVANNKPLVEERIGTAAAELLTAESIPAYLALSTGFPASSLSKNSSSGAISPISLRQSTAGLGYDRALEWLKLDEITRQRKEAGAFTANGAWDLDIKMPEELPPITTVQSRSKIVDFKRQEGVVIAVKIHGHDKNIVQLKQSLCLLQAAYNHKLNYPVVVFVTDPMTDEDVDHLKAIVNPARLDVYIDSKPLPEKILALLPTNQREALFEACNSRNVSSYFWKRKCGTDQWVMGYNWQAEFRSIQIWTHPALAKYRYMLWFDSDALPTEEWTTDPVATFIRNDLVILFDNMQFASGGGYAPVEKRAFGRKACKIRISETPGGIWEQMSKCGEGVRVGSVHGFFHITNLDWYRQPGVLQWMHVMFDNHTLTNVANDQIAVTIPAILYAANRSWEMRPNGMRYNVMHNGALDGKETEEQPNWRKLAGFDKRRQPGQWYLPFFAYQGKTQFPRAADRCSALILNDG